MALASSTGRPHRRKVPRPIREQQILDAAVACFARNGYHATSMDEIAERAGITKPLVYNYFGSKEGLYLAAIERAGDELRDRILTAVAAPDTKTQLEWGVLAFFRFVLERREGWRMLYREAVSTAPGAKQAVAQIRNRIAALVAQQIKQADDAVNDRVRAQPDASAHTIIGAAESLANWSTEHADSTPEQLAAHFLSLVWPGISGHHSQTG
ncbi:MAG: hypothetical protein QOD76_98 [Solirubrobacteraceae bacterium]|jgi:AcrR family transcriptional regulator|nr:hypothetical protein [Solirubrobacteraceae bacterium]